MFLLNAGIVTPEGVYSVPSFLRDVLVQIFLLGLSGVKPLTLMVF